MGFLTARPRRTCEWAARLACVCVLIALACSGAEPGGVPEYDVKAAFVLNFVRFVTWPADSSSGEIQICTTADGPFYQALKRMASGKTIAGRPVRVGIPPLAAIRDCHVLLIEAGGDQSGPAALRAAGGRPILTVCDRAQASCPDGSMFQLLVEDRRVSFEVSLSAVQRSGLQVSSALLRLARNLRKNKP